MDECSDLTSQWLSCDIDIKFTYWDDHPNTAYMCYAVLSVEHTCINLNLSYIIVFVLLAICSCFPCHTCLYLDNPTMKPFNTSLFDYH